MFTPKLVENEFMDPEKSSKRGETFRTVLTSDGDGLTPRGGMTVSLSEKRRLLYKSRGIVGRASGEDLGSETRFQTPGAAILAKCHQHLDFLDPTHV